MDMNDLYSQPPAANAVQYQPGDKVYHPTYGEGEVHALYTPGILVIDVKFGKLVCTVETDKLVKLGGLPDATQDTR